MKNKRSSVTFEIVLSSRSEAWLFSEEVLVMERAFRRGINRSQSNLNERLSAKLHWALEPVLKFARRSQTNPEPRAIQAIAKLRAQSQKQETLAERQGKNPHPTFPSVQHGMYQVELGILLDKLMPAGGRVIFKCPVDTDAGLVIVDVTWVSPGRLKSLGHQDMFPIAPEICVYVLWPGENVHERTALLFGASAEEVWLCTADGRISFVGRPGGKPAPKSKLCPSFPTTLQPY